MWLPTGFGKSICYQMLPCVIDDKLGRVDNQLGKCCTAGYVFLVIIPHLADASLQEIWMMLPLSVDQQSRMPISAGAMHC